MQEMVQAARRGDVEVVYPDYSDPVDRTWVGDATEVAVRMLTADIDRSQIFNVVGGKRKMRDAAAFLASRYPQTKFTPRLSVTPPSA